MLLPARDIFKLIDETIQKNKGPQSYEKFDKEKDLFYAFEINPEIRCLERNLKIYTKQFVLEVSMDINLSDTNKDTGDWEKDYYAVVKNDEHIELGYEPSRSISNDMVMIWFSKHALDFI